MAAAFTSIITCVFLPYIIFFNIVEYFLLNEEYTAIGFGL